jgi:hypothetical protein
MIPRPRARYRPRPRPRDARGGGKNRVRSQALVTLTHSFPTHTWLGLRHFLTLNILVWRKFSHRTGYGRVSNFAAGEFRMVLSMSGLEPSCMWIGKIVFPEFLGVRCFVVIAASGVVF